MVSYVGLSGPIISSGFLRDRRGTWRQGLPVCTAGVALGKMDSLFVREMWHLMIWTVTLGGRYGIYGTRLVGIDADELALLCLLGIALGNMDFFLVWKP